MKDNIKYLLINEKWYFQWIKSGDLLNSKNDIHENHENMNLKSVLHISEYQTYNNCSVETPEFTQYNT